MSLKQIREAKADDAEHVRIELFSQSKISFYNSL